VTTTDPGPDSGGAPPARLIIGVIGGEEADVGSLRAAFEVGRAIGERGHVTLTGGRGGVMREASRGAKEAGGLTLAILPGEDLSEANPFVDIPVITGMGFTRNAVIARTANALIAVDGHYGTLSEIAFGLVAGTPVIAIGSWRLADGRGVEPPVARAGSAMEAVERAVALARVHPRGGR